MAGKASGEKTFFESDFVKNILIWFFQIAVVLACAVVVAIFFFQSVTMQEGSMEPTLAAGERFFINKMAYKLGSPERGDIIVFKTSSKEEAAMQIKRVIGLPGETIQIEEGVSLESGEYFVLGDNRNNSDDSRYGDVGSVQRKNIVGQIWFVAGPVKKIGFLKED